MLLSLTRSTGGLVGGIIGAVIAVAVIVAALVAFLIYRRRQRAKRDEARKEQPQFIDLDGDEDGPGSSAALAARRGRNSGGVSQSYAPTPFTYDPAAAGSSPDLAAAYRDEPLRTPTRPGSFSGQSGRGASISGVSAAGMRYPPSPGTALSDGGRSGWQGTSTMHGSEAGADFMSATSHGPGSVAAGSAYRLSARNAEPAGDAPPLPVKGALPGDDAAVGSSSRYIQHSDAGPMTPAQPAEDAVEEVSLDSAAPLHAQTDRRLTSCRHRTVDGPATRVLPHHKPHDPARHSPSILVPDSHTYSSPHLHSFSMPSTLVPLRRHALCYQGPSALRSSLLLRAEPSYSALCPLALLLVFPGGPPARRRRTTHRHVLPFGCRHDISRSIRPSHHARPPVRLFPALSRVKCLCAALPPYIDA
jgi:hypothetical protein